MCALWGKTKTAINHGYGNFSSMGRATHPEYYFGHPYGSPTRTRASRGGKALVKGSAEAKARMAHLRSLRGKGRTYNSAALRGGEDFIDSTFFKDITNLTIDAVQGLTEQDLKENLGKSVFGLLKDIAKKIGQKVLGLFKKPVELVVNLSKISPKAAKVVGKFLLSREELNKVIPETTPAPKSKNPDREFMDAYLRRLQRDYPEIYNREIAKIKGETSQLAPRNSIDEPPQQGIYRRKRIQRPVRQITTDIFEEEPIF